MFVVFAKKKRFNNLKRKKRQTHTQLNINKVFLQQQKKPKPKPKPKPKQTMNARPGRKSLLGKKKKTSAFLNDDSDEDRAREDDDSSSSSSSSSDDSEENEDAGGEHVGGEDDDADVDVDVDVDDIIDDIDDEDEEDNEEEDEDAAAARDEEEEDEDEEEENEQHMQGKAMDVEEVRDDDDYNDDDDDDDDDEEDDDETEYLKKFDSELKKNYITKFHPECVHHNAAEIALLSHVIRDASNIIIDPNHRTIPFLTKYEKARILGQRSKQLETGSKPFIALQEHVIDSYIIAEMELKQKKIPFIIRRPIPGGTCEYWKLSDLEFIAF